MTSMISRPLSLIGFALGLAVNVVTPSAAMAACGDAVLDAGESCDDGNTSGDDGCSVACRIEPANHLRCYKAKPRGPLPAFVRRTITLADDLETKTVEVRKPVGYCTPADVNGAGVHDPVGRLTCYQI